MKRKVCTFILISLLITALLLSLTACNLFGGSGNNGSGNDNGGNNNGDDEVSDGSEDGLSIQETVMTLSGELPFSLASDFYVAFEMNSEDSSAKQYSAWFIAVRKNDTVYSYYEYDAYATVADKQNYNSSAINVEERLLYNGTNYRKSYFFAGDDNTRNYTEDWNTTVPNGTTMLTTLEYISDFLCGKHTADTPFKGAAQISADKINSYLSNRISRKDAGQSVGVKIFAEGTETVNLCSFYNPEDPTCPLATYLPVTVTKYKGMSTDADTGNEYKVMEVKVWGNLVVSAAPVDNYTRLGYNVSSKYSDTVSAETFTSIINYLGLIYPIEE